MNLKKEFRNYTKTFSKNFDYDISNNELEKIYNDFFGEDGLINTLLSSKIKDLQYEKDLEKNNCNEMELEN